jgi:predicted MPP superfamily phosphohydrolase
MGVLPLRVGCPPEVLVIELTREEPTEEPDDG